MAIAAKRMETFSRDFTTGIADLTEIRDVSALFNIEDFKLDLSNTALTDGVDKLKEFRSNALDTLSTSKDFLEDVTRNAKEQFNKLVDLASLAPAKINEIIDDVFSGFPKGIINAVKSVGTTCRNNALSAGLSAGSSFAGNPNCGSLGVGNANCPPGATQGLLGSIGSDVARALKRGMDAVKKAVQAVATLLGMGYNANLCNVLSSVMEATGIQDKSILSIAAASVLNKEGLRGSVNAAIDLAKSNLGGLGKLAPQGIKLMATNMTMGTALTATTKKSAAAAVRASFDEVDPNWKTTETGTTTHAGMKYNSTMNSLVDIDRKTGTFDTTSISELGLAPKLTSDTKFNSTYALTSRAPMTL